MTAFDPKQRLKRYETQEFRVWDLVRLYCATAYKRPLNLLGDYRRAEFCLRLTRDQVPRLVGRLPVCVVGTPLVCGCRRSNCSERGGERPARWDVAMDRRRRGELFVPVFAPALRILSNRRLDRQRAAPRSSIQFDRPFRLRQQASPRVWVARESWSAGGLDNASAGFVLRCLKTRFRGFRGANFLRVEALSGAHCLDLRPLGAGFLGCFLRRKVDLDPPQDRRGTLDIGPPEAGKTNEASRQSRGRTITFARCSPATRSGCLNPIEACTANCSRRSFRS